MRRILLATLIGVCGWVNAQAATVGIIGTRTELDVVQTEFEARGDTVMRFSSWAGLDASDLMMLESKDIIWEGYPSPWKGTCTAECKGHMAKSQG